MRYEWDSEMMLNRFNQLMEDLLRGKARRNCFAPWEVELLLDIESCEVPAPRKRILLKRYQEAASRRIDSGEPPLKLSEYLRGSLPPVAPQPDRLH
jgi:hypothetical protein